MVAVLSDGRGSADAAGFAAVARTGRKPDGADAEAAPAATSAEERRRLPANCGLWR